MSEKLCVFCKHWCFNGGSPGYGEMTPPEDASMNCEAGRYKNDFFREFPTGFDGQLLHIDEYDFRRILLLAEKCPDYERG